ncbi:MAG: SUMF1/EgtB/PvdO family nonheme iron enzyme [Crocosphaera sp.]|nr:SUMF1/EgtB/PvdO family nonheme iron enzyme [Crocosphaera sp.]
MSRKIALLVGVSEYGEGIENLKAPLNDVAAMKRVLENPNLGNFEVTTLKNPNLVTMQLEIIKLFKRAKKDDLVLFYFSGHGITDDNYELYLPTKSTGKEDFEAMSVAGSFLKKQAENYYVKRKIIILDACYSGSINNEWRSKNISIDLKQFLGKEGLAVLTSSSATQVSFEQEGATLSLYTQYLVEGIETGAATQNDDNIIYIRELHDYAKKKVQEVKPNIKPDILIDKEGYEIIISRAPRNPEADYRKLVEKYHREGEITTIDLLILTPKLQQLGLTETQAKKIEQEVTEPFRRRRENLKQYRQVLENEVKQKYPLDAYITNRLQEYQQDILGLRDEDVEPIKKEIFAPFLSQPQPKETPKKMTPIETPKKVITPPPKPNHQPSLKTFPFQYATLKKLPGTEEVETNYYDAEAQFFTEDLGNGVTLDMVYIPGGTFKMGSPEGQGHDSEYPQHSVTLKPFFMAKYPITQAQWEQVVKLSKIERDLKSNCATFKGDKRPVESISWLDAVEFCQRLSQATGKPYQLPSEAQWEYACRAGTTTPFYFGEIITPDVVNYDGEYSYNGSPKGVYRRETTEVGSLPPNPFGLYDIHGNVWEWCADDWHENYKNAPSDGSAWLVENFSQVKLKMLRGGSWCHTPGRCRSNYRGRRDLGYDSYGIGMRIVLVRI